MKNWVKTGLIFAAWMFIFMTFIAPYLFKLTGFGDVAETKHPIARVVINLVCFVITGLIIGYINRNNGQKKQIDK